MRNKHTKIREKSISNNMHQSQIELHFTNE